MLELKAFLKERKEFVKYYVLFGECVSSRNGVLARTVQLISAGLPSTYQKNSVQIRIKDAVMLKRVSRQVLYAKRSAVTAPNNSWKQLDKFQ